MTLEDPFFVVKDEVSKALTKTRGLFSRWQEIQNETAGPSKDEQEWTSTELRNALRSIEWDLEDLEDTITIVEKNPGKFIIDNRELSTRKRFIAHTREEVKSMKEKMNISRGRDRDRTARQPLLDGNSSPLRASVVGGSGGPARYSRLENEADSPSRLISPVGAGDTGMGGYLDQSLQQQSLMIRSQDDQLDLIADSMGSLKTMSHHIGSELDEQAVMLDDFGHELETAESKLDTTMKKVAKVLHLSNDRRQWMAIAILSVILIIVIILFFTSL